MALSASSKSSRASSLSNLLGIGSKDKNLNMNNEDSKSEGSIEKGQSRSDRRNYDSHDSQSDDDNNDHRPSRHITTLRNHPLGRIFLGIASQDTRQAKKSNLKSMDYNIDELGAEFAEALQIMNDSTQRTVLQATAGMESRMESRLLDKELNAHTMNLCIDPPEFSLRDRIRDLRDKSEAMRIFPTRNKFNGTAHDGHMDIVEYLGLMNDSQSEVNLSEKEFKDMMMATTTGKPHALIRSWIANQEDIPTIYHHLLIHYDSRISPEKAKMELSNFRAQRHSNLAKVETSLMNLAERAACMLPVGPSRKAFYNMEVIQSLIRGLPLASSSMVQQKYNELSARQGRAATAAELSRALHSIRYAIDKDILTNGALKVSPPMYPSIGVVRKRLANKKGPNMRYKSSYAVSHPVDMSQPQMYVDEDIEEPPMRRRAYNISKGMNRQNSDSQNYGTQNSSMGRGNMNRTSNKQFANAGQGRFNNQRPNNRANYSKNSNYQQPIANSRALMKYCSLCGKRNHMAAQGCPNMVNDVGAPIKIMPTLGTCSACPASVNPRLNHPSMLCPYRKGGPFSKSL